MSTDQKPYIVSARKYRPADFLSVVGQGSLTQTLKNAVMTSRIAQAYLFCGPRGVGKTSCARIFARTINCLNPRSDGEACGECESCRAITEGNSFNVTELDAASNNSVGEMRNLTEQVHVPPRVGKYRVFIIDEVHMLSQAAFNAFLKTLEEPPAYAVFILATTEKHKVLPTILSRCQIYDFKRITVSDMVAHLSDVANKEGITAEPRALSVIAQKADGAMRDALSIFDQVAASSGGRITYASAIENLNVLDYEYYFRLVEAFVAGDVHKALLLYKEIRDQGFDSQFFINGLAEHVRDLMVASDSRTASLLEVGSDVESRYKEQSALLPAKWFYAALKLLSDADMAYRTASNKQLVVELALIRLCLLLNDTPVPVAPAPVIPKAQTAAPAPASPSPIRQSAPKEQSAAPRIQQGTRSGVAVGATQRPSTMRISKPGAQRIQHRDVKEAATGDEGAEPEPAAGGAHTLESLWKQFMNDHPEQHLLISAMRNCFPVANGENEYHIVVMQPGQKDCFEKAGDSLFEYLRKGLGDASLKFSVEIGERPERTAMLTDAQIVKKLMSENPTISRLLTGLDAEMV